MVHSLVNSWQTSVGTTSLTNVSSRCNNKNWDSEQPSMLGECLYSYLWVSTANEVAERHVMIYQKLIQIGYVKSQAQVRRRHSDFVQNHSPRIVKDQPGTKHLIAGIETNDHQESPTIVIGTSSIHCTGHWPVRWGSLSPGPACPKIHGPLPENHAPAIKSGKSTWSKWWLILVNNGW